MHVNATVQRACQTEVGSVSGKKVLTIEGLSPTSSHPLQKAWVAEEVRIAADGRITILSAGAEMGQGSMTSLAIAPSAVYAREDAAGAEGLKTLSSPSPA